MEFLACSSSGWSSCGVKRVLGGLVGRSSEVRGRSMMGSKDVLVVFVSYIVRLEEELLQDWSVTGWATAFAVCSEAVLISELNRAGKWYSARDLFVCSLHCDGVFASVHVCSCAEM